jgi:DMSO/TMAO reductase YedYZ heme-binding membrane subunit/ferredoxin
MQSSTAAVHVVAATVGFASTILLWWSILIGIVLSRSWSLSWIKHTTLKTTHMSMAIMGLVLGVVHGLAQLAAPGTTVHWIDEIIPFINPARPLGVGLGTVALEMMLALALTVPIQRKLGHARWRSIHSTAYLAYTVTVGHLLFTGSEVNGWVTWATLASWVITVALWATMSPKMSKKLGTAGKQYVEQKANETTVNVNPHVCARFGFCEHEAPEVFQLRGNGRLAYRANVEPHEVDAVYSAIRICPARAISMTGPGVPFDLRVPPGAGAAGAGEAGLPNLAPVSPSPAGPTLVPPPAPGPVPVSPAVPVGPPVSRIPPAPPVGPVPAGAGAPRPTARLGPFPPGGPGRRHGQPVEPPPPPPLRSVPAQQSQAAQPDLSRYDNVTGLRPRGGNR